ncbi:MAG: cytochrome c [Myxococcales bacterium]|nr:cytochrome c [Myxococcales bacterium]
MRTRQNIFAVLAVLTGAVLGAIGLACDINLNGDTVDTDLTWYNFGQPFFSTYCGSCHQSFLNYNRVTGSQDEIRRKVDSRSMPPNDSGIVVPDSDIARLLEWIDADLPEGSPTGDDDSAGLYWTNFAEAFFAGYCTRCHSDPPINDAEIPLVTLSDVRAEMHHVQEHVVDGEMPPSAPFPTAAERQDLSDWIDAGAPYDENDPGVGGDDEDDDGEDDGD